MYSAAQLRDQDRPVTMGPDWAKASRSPVVGLTIEKCVCVCVCVCASMQVMSARPNNQTAA